MLKLVVKRPPILAPSPKTQVKKNFLKPVVKNLPQSKLYPHKTDPIPPVQNKPVAPKPADTGKPKTEPKRHNSGTNTKLAVFDRNVKQMQKEQQNSRSNASKKAAPKFIKPPEQERLKKSLKLADGGKEGAASGDYRVNPKTDKLETREVGNPSLPTVIPEYSKEADIISSLPTDFDFKGWDNKPARQQQKELQKAGLNPEEQMVLLNSKTSLDTLATIVDINRNRDEYGLSDSNVKQIAEELLQIADARIGASSHDLPLGTIRWLQKHF